MSRTDRMETWQLHPQARLRRTPTGGALFLPPTITTVELGAEAFTAVLRLATPHTPRDLRRRLLTEQGRNITLAEVDILLQELAQRGAVCQSGPEVPPPSVHLPFSSLPAPESVHLQLNTVCNLRCPSCYVALESQKTAPLPPERLDQLLDEWAEMGVFQLALGGGEPLLSPLFAPVVRAARQRGIVPNGTTNGWLITEALLDELADYLGEWRLSLNDAVTVNLPLLEARAALLRARGLRFGFHLIVTRRNLRQLPDLLAWACRQEATTLNLIRPKPAPGNRPWYQEHCLSAGDATDLVTILEQAEALFTRTALSVDCAFSFLLQGQPVAALQARGVAGCAMGERFVTIQANGDVYPCSHLQSEEFKAGNVRNDSFRTIWEQSEVFRSLRRNLEHVAGNCNRCTHHAVCKGCRAIMRHQTGAWLAADAGCRLAK